MKAVPKKDEGVFHRKGRTAAEIMATSRRQMMSSWVLTALVRLAAALSVLIVVILIGYILVTGIPHLRWDLFAWEYTTQNQSMMPALVNTVCMTLLTLLVAVPIGVCAAIYLAEYAKRGNRLVKLVRLTAETLAGIPSIVYGLFGYVFFNIACGWSFSLLAGAMTLAMMILPLILRTTEEALRSVPDSFREGSFGLGAGRLRTVFCVILPPAMPGILAGVVLSVGRIVGESAALIFTAGSGTANLAFGKTGVFSIENALAIHSSSRVFQSSNIPFLRLLTVRRRKMRIVGKYRFQQLVAECFCASVIEKQLRNDGLSVPLCCDDTIRLLLRGGCGFLFCHWVTPSFGCKKRISHSWKIPFCCRLFCFTIRAAQRLAPFALPDIPAP